MNYGTLIYKEYFSRKQNRISENVFCVCVVLQVVVFNMFMGFVVVFCIYEHILKICFKNF